MNVEDKHNIVTHATMMATLGAEFDIKDMGAPCAADGFGFLIHI
jgi:hypothetical protein